MTQRGMFGIIGDPSTDIVSVQGASGGTPQTVSSAPLPTGATAVSNSSGNVANASAVSTLAGAASKTTYLTSFTMTASGSTAGLPVVATITGLLGGTQSFIFTFPAGVLVGAAPIVMTLDTPAPASAVNTAIVVTLPAGGAGNTNAATSATGYQV